jgi:hypothetical protein
MSLHYDIHVGLAIHRPQNIRSVTRTLAVMVIRRQKTDLGRYYRPALSKYESSGEEATNFP